MTSFEALLDVQVHDTAADRLRHRLAHLPERADLAAKERRGGELASLLAQTQARLKEIEERQSALESEVAVADRRIREIETRMYSGEVSATRDLLAMTAEISALTSRRSGLEDDALAAMEEAEPLAEEARALEDQLASLASEAAESREAIGQAEAEIADLLRAETESRRTAVEGVDPELLAMYEKLRAELGGVGAARLVGTSCSGCHLTLPASEVARIKRSPPDALLLCDQCGRILIP